MNVRGEPFPALEARLGPIGLSAFLPTESALTSTGAKIPIHVIFLRRTAHSILGVVRFGHFGKQLPEVLKQSTGPFGALIALEESRVCKPPVVHERLVKRLECFFFLTVLELREC